MRTRRVPSKASSSMWNETGSVPPSMSRRVNKSVVSLTGVASARMLTVCGMYQFDVVKRNVSAVMLVSA